MKFALRAYGLTQVAILAYMVYYLFRPNLNADTNAHLSIRRDGPVHW